MSASHTFSGVELALGAQAASLCSFGATTARRTSKPSDGIRAGFRGEKTFPHWLAKIRFGTSFVDLIYAAGNGLCEVDDSWFERARAEQLLGVPVKVVAPEEIIWMKAFVQERERFDIFKAAPNQLTGRICGIDSAKTGACSTVIWFSSATSFHRSGIVCHCNCYAR